MCLSNFRKVCCFFTLLLLFNFEHFFAEAKVKTIKLSSKYSIDTSQITVSGHSAGGAYAHLYHLIHSKLFIGVGIIAGYPYKAHEDRSKVIESLKSNAKQGLIDDSSNIKNDRVFTWSGTKDEHSSAGERVDGVEELYKRLLKSPKQLTAVIQKGAHHALSTGYCSKSSSKPKKGPFTEISTSVCDYDVQFNMFKFIFGNKFKPDKCKSEKCQYASTKGLYIFDQTKYFPKKKGSGLGKKGLFYVPPKCNKKGKRKTKCLFHLFFHGCSKKWGKNVYEYIKYVRNREQSNLINLAKKNNMILLMPTVKKCFVKKGEKGQEKNYDNKNGMRVKIVRAMVKKVTKI